ncbi:hypothetical protein [Anaeromyxobacter terrae]|uniref:hypothetical protein n=1 Tax=Anaeromyxobacter terrae TaxID=2925406 RepID=UPI001F5A9C1B|nr:hypothetical protein [Anaeromyxobacter sp. SG22]
MRRFLLHCALLVAAAVSFAAYEHLKLQGASTESTLALVAAAGLGLSPLRAVVHELFTIEGALLHFVHGMGGLALMGLTLGGVISGRPVLDHAALAPFTIMGAAQSMMHQPRNAEQAVALRRFVTSISEVRTLTRSGALGSTANVRQSVAILSELIAKAQALGETELRSDPAFQSAFRRTLLRTGVSLELDSVEEALGTLGTNPAAASSVTELRRRLAAARHTFDR